MSIRTSLFLLYSAPIVSPAEVFRRITEDETLIPCVSPEIVQEYAEVLTREKFQFPPEKIELLLQTLGMRSEWFSPATATIVSTDDADNRFLECAEAAEADYLVTGNKRHFPEQWKNTRVVTARELLDVLPRKKGE